jgi:hypothetical protein
MRGVFGGAARPLQVPDGARAHAPPALRTLFMSV